MTDKYTGPMYHAIVTKYSDGAITASCERGRIRAPYNHALSGTDNHYAAARALIEKLDWRHKPGGALIGGSVKDGYVWVLT